MNTSNQFRLEDAKKKLSCFSLRLENLVRSACNSAISAEDILSAVSEIEYLISWAAGQPELVSEYDILMMKLEQLHRIREILEYNKILSTCCPPREIQDDHTEEENPDDIRKYMDISKDDDMEMKSYTNVLTVLPADNTLLSSNEEVKMSNDKKNNDFIASDKHSDENETICEEERKYICDPNSHAENENNLRDKDIILPNTDFEGQNLDSGIDSCESLVQIANNTVQSENIILGKSVASLNGEPNANSESQNSNVVRDSLILNSDSESLDTPLSLNFESEDASDAFKTSFSNSQVNTENQIVSNKVITLTEDLISFENGNLTDEYKSDIPLDSSSEDQNSVDAYEFLKTNQEIFQSSENTTSNQNQSSADVTAEADVDNASSGISQVPKDMIDGIVILETDENNETQRINNCSSPSDPLDVCMFAIKNLYESLKIKENELLKLSVMQNDQKQIDALQEVVIEFHKEITNLNSRYEDTKKENAVLKEQVLELEEAENDARLQAQKLEEKLLFLQEKDSHSQADICELKQNLAIAANSLTQRETEAKELRSELKYIEELVKKYEDQFKVLETRNLELKNQLQFERDEAAAKKVDYSFKGTQTYDPVDLKAKTKPLDENPESKRRSACFDKYIQVPESFGVLDCAVQTESSEQLHSQQNSKYKDQTESIESPMQKQLLERLQLLVEEDVRLQQQLLYVDEINLALWKKLQSLESNIGECKKNLNELTPDEIEKYLNVPSLNGQENNETQQSNIPEKSLPEGKQKEEKPVATDQNVQSNLEDATEREILDRLSKLELINAAFEKELKIREGIFKEKERIHEDWIKIETQYIEELQKLRKEKQTLTKELEDLRNQKEELEKKLFQQQSSLKDIQEKNRQEIDKIKRENRMATVHLYEKIENLLIQEKEHLKMIANLKSERHKSEDKNELERLKYSYIELQTELSTVRDDLKAIEDKFKIRQEECGNKHKLQETKLISEIESLRYKNANCSEMITKLLLRQDDLVRTLSQKENELETARINHKNVLRDIESKYRTVEVELKSQLREIEEGTAKATATLTEERKKVEEELQKNIKDLRANEETYKVRIVELESKVLRLHEELLKVTSNGDVEKLSKTETSDTCSENIISDLTAERAEAFQKSEEEEPGKSETCDNSAQGERFGIERNGDESRKDEKERGDLMNELLEAEKREKELKLKIVELEKMQNMSKEKIKDLEKNRERIDMQLVEKNNRLIKVNSFLRESQRVVETQAGSPGVGSRPPSVTAVSENPSQQKGPLNEQSKQSKHYSRTKMPEMKTQEETVATLRAQVRELQSQLERISDDDPLEIETPKQFPLTSRTVCKGYEEDFDYAEVEDCLDVRTRPEGCSPAKHVYDLDEGKINYKFEDTDRENKQPGVKQAEEENDYDEILPRPTNFRVVQQVGTDTLLLGWNYVNPAVLDGYDVFFYYKVN